MIDWVRAQTRLGVIADGRPGPLTWAALLARVGAVPRRPLHTDLGVQLALQSPAVLDRPLRLAHFLAQSSVETGGFTRMVESLNYQVAGLLGTFGRHRISAADAQRLGRKSNEGPLSAARQAEIANLVYGGAFGREQLGNTVPGDGWHYRGRGLKQTTGRANYGEMEAETDLPVIAQPELLERPDTGTQAGLLFWQARECARFADADDITGLTKRINGGTNGLPERRAALARAKAILL